MVHVPAAERSSLVESIWPSFTKVGPSCSKCEPRALLHFKMHDFGGFPPLQYMSCVLEQRSDTSATHEVSEPMPHEDRA